ncbi:MAG: helix-turn-helix transcriptional regulator [Acidimicrobiaceae bacterium]|nr:helix-turn-helix transcriptional regulator [Acidimicrobiaceae bacterium]
MSTRNDRERDASAITVESNLDVTKRVVVVQLSESDVREVIAVAEQCLSAHTLDEFIDTVLTSCQQLVSSDVITYNEVELGVPEITFRELPGESYSPDLLTAFLYHLDDHPVIARMRRSGSGAAIRISDVVSSREFHNRGIYSDFFHRLGLEDQVAISLRVNPTRIIGIAANRDCVFTHNERDRFEMLRPLLVSAYHSVTRFAELERVTEYLRLGLSSAGCDVFMLSDDGGVVECTDGALRRLSAALPLGTEESVPVFLAHLARVSKSLRWEAAGARWMASTTHVDAGVIVTIRRDGLPHAAELQSSLGVSKREAQVLVLIAEGQTSAEVARTLDISVRTVHKHLEHLYRCLGASSRSEAATIARSVTEDFHSGT